MIIYKNQDKTILPTKFIIMDLRDAYQSTQCISINWIVNLYMKINLSNQLTLNKMLIRHISIPKNTHLISLAQPKEKDQHQSQDVHQYNSYFTKTLNPQHPIQDVFTSPKEGPLTPHIQQHKYRESQKQTNAKYLNKQSPQIIDQFQPSLQSPKKQIYSPTYESIKIRDEKRRPLPTFSPLLNRSAYLKQDNPEYQLNNYHDGNRFQYIKAGQDQQDEAINNKHYNSPVKNREVYRTLQKFRAKNKSQLQDSRLRSHKKYTYDPIKNNPNPPIITQKHISSQRQIQKKQNKLQPLSARRQKPHVSNPSLNQKKRKVMPDDQEETQNQIVFRKLKPKTTFRKTSEEEKVPQSKPQTEIYLSSKYPKEPFSPSKKEIGQIFMQISYRTSLSRLRQICSLSHLQKYNIIMKIPQIFAYPLFSGAQSQDQLFNKAEQILKHLQIPRKDLSLKKYSNCIVILSGALGVIWHFNGKVYVGGWKHQILDEGAKHGLGLQWVPKKYVYYGQFNKSKREGVGIMKTCENQILAGTWRDNQFLRSLSIDATQSFTQENQVFDQAYD